MDRDQVTDLDRFAGDLDADDRALALRGDDDRVADLDDGPLGADGAAVKSEPLAGVDAVIAAAVEHHHRAHGSQLPAIVPEDDLPGMVEVRCPAPRFGDARRAERLQVIPFDHTVTGL